MRGTVAFIVLSLLTVGAFAGSFYGEKEDAKKVVNDKFEEVKKLSVNVYKHVVDERKKIEGELETEKQLKETLETETGKTLREFAADISATTRTAIAKGKPLSVIDCIMKVALEGHDIIVKTKENFQEEVKNIRGRKESALKMAEFQINLIGTAARDLKDESLKKIDAATSGFQALQADAVKKMDATKRQLEELEARVPKPDVSAEFIALKRQVVPKLKDVKDSYVKKLQKCL